MTYALLLLIFGIAPISRILLSLQGTWCTGLHLSAALHLEIEAQRVGNGFERGFAYVKTGRMTLANLVAIL